MYGAVRRFLFQKKKKIDKESEREQYPISTQYGTDIQDETTSQILGLSPKVSFIDRMFKYSQEMQNQSK